MCSEEGVAVNVFTWKAQKSHNILDLVFFTRQRDALLQLQIPLIPVLISYVAAKLSFCRSCFSMMCHSYYCSDELLAPREKNCHSSVLFFFLLFSSLPLFLKHLQELLEVGQLLFFPGYLELNFLIILAVLHYIWLRKLINIWHWEYKPSLCLPFHLILNESFSDHVISVGSFFLQCWVLNLK